MIKSIVLLLLLVGSQYAFGQTDVNLIAATCLARVSEQTPKPGVQ